MHNQFVSFIGLAPYADLHYGNNVHGGFSVVDHGDTANETEQTIRKIKGIADCHPPLSSHKLVFRRLSSSYFNVFDDRKFVDRMVSEKDELKHLLKSFGLLALRCYKEKVNLDLNLRNIHLSLENPQLIKGIVLEKGAEIQFQDWKGNVIKVYNEVFHKIRAFFPLNDYELTMLVDQLKMANNPEEVVSYFQGWVYWSTYKRMGVILKFPAMLRKIGLLSFADYCDVSKLTDWRQIMLLDNKVALLVPKIVKNNNFGPTGSWEKHEVDFLLNFVSVCIGHFSELTDNRFPSEYLLLKHLDTNFPRIMGAVYEGCVAVDMDRT